jgi:HSP20 family molecular chaperone IbpA
VQKRHSERDRDRWIDRAILDVDRLREALSDPAPSGTERNEGIDAARLAGAHAELATLVKSLAIMAAAPEAIAEAPACSLRDNGAEIEALFELPGVSRGSLRVHYASGYLVVEGSRRDSSEDGQPVLASRPRSGPFRQTVAVPIAIDAAGASALYREGCLTIRLPKRGGASPRRARS